MLRRLYADQPASFAFTAANAKWAQAQIAKYPEGRQASAIISLQMPIKSSAPQIMQVVVPQT